MGVFPKPGLGGCDHSYFQSCNGRVLSVANPAELRTATGDENSTLEEAFLYQIHQGSDNEY